MTLPCPTSLKWAHSTNSRLCLESALNDESINAIEADILIGSSVEEGEIVFEKNRLNQKADQSLSEFPIMAHPPHRSSHLSLQTFLSLALKPSFKHIKLDMKELQAVSATLSCLLTQIENCTQERQSGRKNTTIFLNADIFLGPGCRDSLNCVEAEPFVEACMAFLGQFETLSNETRFNLALSLGFKVDYRSKEEYTREDCEKMACLVRKFHLNDGFGLVLALNARVLCLSPRAFDPFLREFKHSQILAWTGTGEPPIARSVVDKLVDDFQQNLLGERIGFDCSYV